MTNPTPIGVIEDDDHQIRYYHIAIEDADRVRELFPAVHCQHGYDCCGNWYPNGGRVIHQNESYGYAVVEQNWYLNV